MDAILIDDRIIVEDKKAISRLVQRGFGKVREKKLELSLVEGLFLVENGTLEVNGDIKEITGRMDDEEFQIKYRVYKDLRERGYVLKTGFKFGAHFRVYEKGKSLDGHSKYLVHAVTENHAMSFIEVSRAVRLAQGVKKQMMFAVVDDDGDITYYLVDRITP
jgi:tRNA-intron endonuclease, archaea type